MLVRYAKRVNFWMKRYENFVGLTEVKAAQGKVVQMEKAFVETQELRRELRAGLRKPMGMEEEQHGS